MSDWDAGIVVPVKPDSVGCAVSDRVLHEEPFREPMPLEESDPN